MFKAEILADSLHPNGSRLTSFELTYPRFIHSEFMTHRKFSRNSASSRAIPTPVLLKQIEENPVIPIHWGRLQKGMQAYDVLKGEAAEECEKEWLLARDEAVASVKHLYDLKLHKQIANRLLEPWMWITVVATSDHLGLANFFKLRCHEAAEPHIQKLAWMMRELYENNKPSQLNMGDKHAPYSPDDHISVARCARLSYLNQLGKVCKTCDGTGEVHSHNPRCWDCRGGGRVPWSKADDYALHDRLAESGHWSPFEHQAEAVGDNLKCYGNFCPGWFQYRKTFKGEDGCEDSDIWRR